jgi:F-type H+-transporting ATPase subunit epsilon
VATATTDAITAPGKLGEFEVFPGHVPLLTQLHAGVLTLGDKDAKQVFAVSNGFLEVEASGTVQVLVERAVAAGKINLDKAKADMDELRPELRDWKGALDAEFDNLKARHDWAQAQLDAHARIK